MISVKTYTMIFMTVILLILPMQVLLARESLTDQKNDTIIAEDTPQATISIHYIDEDIINIINMLAEKKEVNVILPTGAHALKIKVNFSLPYKVTLDRAWELLRIYLDMAGYSLLPKNDMYIIVKNNKETFDANNARYPTRLFIETPLDMVPSTDERITYLYYFSNIKVGDTGDNRIKEIAAQLLPDQSFYRIDNATNSILLTAKAFDIKSFMELIMQVDHTEYKEKLEVIPLRHASAEQVARIFNEQILKNNAPTTTARFRADLRKPTEDAYFPESIKIIAYKHRNALVALGRAQAIERVRDFVYKYIDIELESGKSILHVYRLQYLDATSFAPVLQRIITSSRSGGTGQSVGGQQVGSTERYFGDVVITADKPLVQQGGSQYAGSNKLIIAARSEDWKRIKELIEQLDRPQPQVIIEVLIADLTLNDTRQLANQFRNPAAIPLAGSISAQAAHLLPVTIQQGFGSGAIPKHTNATTVATDLLEQSIKNVKGSSTSAVSINDLPPELLTPGATILQMADENGQTWDILKILSTFSYANILSHPHMVVTSNHKAVMSSGESRLVTDEADPSTAGTVIKKKQIDAKLMVEVTPRISSEKEVILQIVIDIDEFTTPSTDTSSSLGDRNKRKLVTSAYLRSGEVLALGGLVKNNLADSTTDTPWISKIPILGWLFKGRKDVEDQTSLTVFITPTVISPKLRTNVESYTRTYADIIQDYSNEETLFHGLKDPITRWFFDKDIKANEEVESFIKPREYQEKVFQAADTLAPVKKKKIYKKKEKVDPVREEQLSQKMVSSQHASLINDMMKSQQEKHLTATGVQYKENPEDPIAQRAYMIKQMLQQELERA